MLGEKPKTVAIVGGGLVGCLQACYLAEKNSIVNVYEKRPDVRLPEFVPAGVSINMAASERAVAAWREVGLDAEILELTVPMVGRMVHDLDGTRRAYQYGTNEECIRSVGRQLLNEKLLTAAERCPNVTLHFEHQLQSCDLDRGKLIFLNKDGEEVEESADLIIGCDGAYSLVRREMIKKTRVDFSQKYIRHGYAEIFIPAKEGNKYRMEENYLHVWPRNEFMLIAQANRDATFTGTLFMPFDHFNELKTADDALNFFKREFPDSVDIIGEKHLLSIFRKLKVHALISIECDPFHYKDRCVIMGDAAHAIVPFYAQGMNCGMEDCLVLKEAMDLHPTDLEAALGEYTRRRTVDAKAINELAMYNYVELRSKVNSRLFLLRRRVDRLLNWLVPDTWIPLYTTVSFTRIPYHQCIANKAWQDKVIKGVSTGFLLAALLVMLCAFFFFL